MQKPFAAVAVAAAILAFAGCQASDQGAQQANNPSGSASNQNASMTISQPGGNLNVEQPPVVNGSQQNGQTTPFTGMQYPSVSTQQFPNAPEFKPLPGSQTGTQQSKQTTKPPEFKTLPLLTGTTQQK